MFSKPVKGITMLVLALLLLATSVVQPASATPTTNFEIDHVAVLGVFTGTWTSEGLINSEGEAFYHPMVAGWDQDLGIFRTGHELTTFTDDFGEFQVRMQGHSAIVYDKEENAHAGYEVNWAIVSGTGAYATLRGQGNGIAWPDLGAGVMNIQFRGEAHFEP
ncbi:MAG: hypothetical protein KAS38_09010 [Anaerolineales bacterium]|nr:hypothetical protein [Anaerolineales bacterium]